MMDQQLIVAELRTATESVFSTMLGLELAREAPFIDTNQTGPSSCLIGLVGLAGAWVGTVSVTCSAAMARESRRRCSAPNAPRSARMRWTPSPRLRT